MSPTGAGYRIGEKGLFLVREFGVDYLGASSASGAWSDKDGLRRPSWGLRGRRPWTPATLLVAAIGRMPGYPPT